MSRVHLLQLTGLDTNRLTDSFTARAKPQVYLLGQTVNIQVSAPHLPPGWKLYINSCYAAPNASKSSLKYAIIDNLGYVKAKGWMSPCVLVSTLLMCSQLYGGQQARARGFTVHFSDRQHLKILLKGLPVHS